MSGPLLVIQPGGAGALRQLAELWRFRELLGLIAWRDFRVRYRQTIIGAGWALAEPLVAALLFTWLFRDVAGLASGPVPYPLFCCAGALVWTFFSRSLRSASASLVANSGLLGKAYFPRLVLPVAGVSVCVVDFGVALLAYLGLAAWYGAGPGPRALLLPMWAGLIACSATGLGAALAVVNVRYRDVGQALPFMLQVWMFTTPVAYPLTAAPPNWTWLLYLNPLTGLVEGARWSLLPNYPLDPALALGGATSSVALLLLGLACFLRGQRGLADVI